jgi:hypothetical protein
MTGVAAAMTARAVYMTRTLLSGRHTVFIAAPHDANWSAGEADPTLPLDSYMEIRCDDPTTHWPTQGS